MKMIDTCDEKSKHGFLKRVDHLKKQYDEMSETYQKSNNDSDIPLS